MIQVIPPGKYRTLNMCDFCLHDPKSCKGSRVFGEVMKYVPGRNNYYRNMYKKSSRNVIACDKFWRKK